MKITIGQTPSMPVAQSVDSAESAAVELTSNQSMPASARTNTDVQLLLKQAIQSMVKQLNGAIVQQKSLVDFLPDVIQSYANEIFRQNMPDDTAVSQGLAYVLRGQKNAFDQLGALAKSLAEYSEILSQVPDTQLNDVVAFLNTAKQQLVKNTAGSAVFSTNQQEQDTNGFLSGNLTKLANTLLSQPQDETLQLVRNNWQQLFGRQERNSDKPLAILQAILKDVLTTAVPPNRQETTIPTGNSPVPEQALAAKESGMPGAEPQVTTSQNKSNPEVLLKSNGTAMQTNTEAGVQNEAQPLMTSAMTKETAGILENEIVVQTPAKNAAMEEGSLEHLDPKKLIILKENIEQKSTAILNPPDKNTPQTAGQSSPIAEKLASVIRQLVQSDQQNMPAIIRQAVLKFDLPELQDLWLLANITDSAELAKLPQKKLQKAGQDLEEVVTSLKKACTIQGQAIENHKSISFATPIYLGENQQAVPAFIHIYHQDKQQQSGAMQQEAETWIRISLSTENAGNVNLIFHLYNENLLNLQVAFSETEAARLFDDYVPAIRSTINESFITLADVNISTAVENE